VEKFVLAFYKARKYCLSSYFWMTRLILRKIYLYQHRNKEIDNSYFLFHYHKICRYSPKSFIRLGPMSLSLCLSVVTLSMYKCEIFQNTIKYSERIRYRNYFFFLFLKPFRIFLRFKKLLELFFYVKMFFNHGNVLVTKTRNER